MNAIPGIPIVSDGIIILLSKIPPHPEHGTKSVFKHPNHNNAGIVIIIGIDIKNKEIETINASSIINCAGLNSYNIAKKIMNQNLKIPALKIYKGSYFALNSKWRNS